MILVAYRHGLRASELVDLRWDQVEFASGTLHVRRVKQGTPSTHPILGDELRALRRLQREQEPKSAFVFTSERGGPPSAPPGSLAWSSGQGRRPNCPSRRTRTCSGMPAAMRSRTRGTIHGRYRRTWATAISSTLCDIPNYRQPDLRRFGGLAERPDLARDVFRRLSTATRQQFNFGGSLIGFENIFHFR